MNKNDDIAMLERLKSEKSFSDFKLKKSDKSLIRKFDWGWQKISFDHYNGFDPDRKDLALVVKPSYNVRFNIYHKWFEKYSPINLKDQRERDTVGFDEVMLGKPKTFLGFYFLESREDYEEDYEVLKKDVIEHASYIFNRFQTLKDVYDYRIGELLSGNLRQFRHGSDWIFEDLFLARIVSPQNYQYVKRKILERLEAIYNNIYTRSDYVEMYYAKASEIIAYLESIPIDNIPSNLIGNDSKS